MASKPTSAREYAPKDLALVREACLTLATYLGSFIDDVVIVGGLVPTLLIPAQGLKAGAEPHVGTRDLDLGLSLALLEESRYAELVEHLRSAGFGPDVTAQGKPANHRWKHPEGVTVDFLIAPSPSASPGATKIRVIERDLSAVLATGIPLAFKDRRKVTLSGVTLRDEPATRELWVCGPGAFVVLKALAFRGRGENKDAYDLFYLLQNFGTRYVEDVAAVLRTLAGEAVTQEALGILEADFANAEAPGPRRAADFLGRAQDDADYRADLAGAVRELLRILGR